MFHQTFLARRKTRQHWMWLKGVTFYWEQDVVFLLDFVPVGFVSLSCCCRYVSLYFSFPQFFKGHQDVLWKYSSVKLVKKEIWGRYSVIIFFISQVICLCGAGKNIAYFFVSAIVLFPFMLSMIFTLKRYFKIVPSREIWRKRTKPFPKIWGLNHTV